jgi:hypothetical protein
MAAYTKVSQYFYIGASTDTKPTSVEAGVYVLETDTRLYISPKMAPITRK